MILPGKETVIIMRIYLDNCSLNRPYDALDLATVNLEAQAKLTIRSQAFDYTKWQREHYDNMTPEAVRTMLDHYSRNNSFHGQKAVII